MRRLPQQIEVLSGLIGDVAAPLAQPKFDVAEHVASVTKRLDSPVESARDFATNRVDRFHRGAGCSRGAGGVRARTAAERTGGTSGALEARGGTAHAGLSRDIGVQLYALDPSLHALASGAQVRAGTPLTAGLRNLGDGAAYLLLFGVDSKHAVHWIAPSREPGHRSRGGLRFPRLLNGCSLGRQLSTTLHRGA